MKKLALFAAAALWATPALADHHETSDGSEEKADGTDKAKRLDALLALPAQADKLRDSGMDAGEVAEALDAAKGAGLDAGETTEVLSAAETGEDGDAWQGNFGSWVKTQLDEGKRGQDLKAAIQTEKASRKEAKEAAKAAGTWKGKGGDMAAEAKGKGKGGDMAAEAKDKGKDMAAEAKGKGGDMAAEAKGKGKDMAAEAKGKGGDMAAEAKDKGGDMAAEAKGKGKDRAAEAKSKGKDRADKAAETTQRGKPSGN